MNSWCGYSSVWFWYSCFLFTNVQRFVAVVTLCYWSLENCWEIWLNFFVRRKNNNNPAFVKCSVYFLLRSAKIQKFGTEPTRNICVLSESLFYYNLCIDIWNRCLAKWNLLALWTREVFRFICRSLYFSDVLFKYLIIREAVENSKSWLFKQIPG